MSATGLAHDDDDKYSFSLLFLHKIILQDVTVGKEFGFKPVLKLER